jgi:short-subunit dehydrogenase involved in D-alanine esterification of teichoic acids
MTQSALIQGGAGGLGRALVDRILQSNQFDQVLVTARDIQRMEPTDPRVIPVELDLLSDQSISEAGAVVASHIHKLHLAVTTAGILQNESLGLKPEKKLSDLTRSIVLDHFFGMQHLVV